MTEASEPAEPPVEANEVEPPGPLPDVVRARVVTLAADALGRLPTDQLPAPLKRVASFAPARRARLAGSQIASVLETDDTFRDRVAGQVRALLPELAEALDSATTPAAADPVDLAAVAYLLRPDGWTTVVASAVDVAEAERSTVANRQITEQVDRLRRHLQEATNELRNVRERNREQVADLKAENATLRRKLGEARARARTAEAVADEARSRTESATAETAGALGAADAETRRLRGRIDELERDIAAARRTGRAEKDEGTLRARLLLDTMLDTAQGLRRELALPAVEGAPADAVEADVAEQGSRTPSSHGSLASDDPVLLDQLLNLPRVHMIVDGYNVTKNAWPDCSLEIQRDRLLAGLAPLAARSGAEITVVFDAADKAQRPLVNRPRGVRVLYSPVGVIADDVIRQLVAAEPQGRPVVVVSTDQEIARDVVRAGARSLAAASLSRLITRA